MIGKSCAALLAIFVGSSLTAQETSFSECTAMVDDQQRLTCYDNLADYVAPEPEVEADSSSVVQQIASAWIFLEEFDQFTDKNTSGLALYSNSDTHRGEDPPSILFMRCDGDGGYFIVVGFDGYIGSDNKVPVRYRFDDQEAISERWNGSTNGNAAFLPGGYNDFKAGVLEGKSFAFEVTDFRGSTSAARFENMIDPKFDFITNGCR